jgi:hypothetical protein
MRVGAAAARGHLFVNIAWTCLAIGSFDRLSSKQPGNHEEPKTH